MFNLGPLKSNSRVQLLLLSSYCVPDAVLSVGCSENKTDVVLPSWGFRVRETHGEQTHK